MGGEVGGAVDRERLLIRGGMSICAGEVDDALLGGVAALLVAIGGGTHVGHRPSSPG